MTHNPTLAKVYDLALLPSERLGVRRLRDRLASDLSGRVIEVAVGTGLNLPHYPPTAIVHGVDPDPHMLQKASKRALQAPAAIHLYRGDAPPPVVRRRQLRLCGDRLRAVYGHPTRGSPTRSGVASSHRRGTSASWSTSARLGDRRARWQDRLAPAWERFAGGCRLNQDTLAILEAAGFRVERLWRSTKGGVVSSEARPT